MAANKNNISKEPVAVYFLGSGRLATPVLQRLQDAPEIDLRGAGTQPDRPAGRRRRLQPTAVGEYAASHGLDIDQPASVNTAEFLQRIAECRPEILVVVAFGQLLKKPLLEAAPFGCLNIHASILPAYRGASPIAAAILAGDQEAGVAFMRMNEGLDTGPVYKISRLPIEKRETTGELEGKLGELARLNIVEVLLGICRGGWRPEPQDDRQASHAPKIKKEAGVLDWSRPASELDRFIRAYEPWPRAVVQLAIDDKGKKRLQLTQAQAVEVAAESCREPGTVCRVNAESFTITCGRGGIQVQHLIPEGKRPMSAADFLRGHKIREGLKIIQ